MEPERSTVSERERRLQDVIHAYEKELDAGRTPDQQEILARDPGLADTLTAYFADRKACADLFKGLRRVTPSEPEEPDLPSFGDYQILGRLGLGGMGVVYRAYQVSLKRDVALKVIKNPQEASAADLLRFRSEAEKAATLDH